MKKFFALLLCLALLPGMALAARAETAADEEASEEAYAFTFRGGVQWEMSAEEVRTAEAEWSEAHSVEEEEPQEAAMGQWTALGYAGAPVSKFKANLLIYLLLDDRLESITYDFSQLPAEELSDTFNYLVGALGSVYGELEAADKRNLLDFLDSVNKGFYTEEDIRNCMLRTLPDGTLVYIFYYSSAEFCIMYVNGAFDPSQVDKYETSGL